jgi:hypothetical protein
MPDKPDNPHKPEHEFHIQIDRALFETTEAALTGSQLRQLPPSPIPSDRDLYEIRPGDADLLIGDSYSVTMRDGLRFFTAPKQINPGT